MPESLIALRPTKGAFRAMVNAGHFALPEGTSPDQVWEESMCPGFTYKFFNIQMLQYARSIGTDSQNVPDDVGVDQFPAVEDLLHGPAEDHFVRHARHVVEFHEIGQAVFALDDVTVVVQPLLDEALDGVAPEGGVVWKPDHGNAGISSSQRYGK